MESYCCCDTDKHIFRTYISYRNEHIFKEFEGIVIGKCTSCGLLRTFIPSKSTFNPKKSDAKFYEENKNLFFRLFEPTLMGIQKYRKNGEVLDIGCSSGVLLELLKGKGYSVHGIEPNDIAYRVAYKKFGDRIVHGTIDTYKTTKKFDVITIIHVLEHVPDPVGTVKKMKSLLTKDGIIVVGIPNTRNVIFTLRKKYWEYLRPNEHIWHFSDRYLINMLQKNGFKIMNIWYVDDERSGYPPIKRFYFTVLHIVDRIWNTGETVSVVCRKN